MAIQYYNIISTGKKYALDKTTGQVQEVSSIPQGGAILNWSGSSLPSELSKISQSQSSQTPTPQPAPQINKPYIPPTISDAEYAGYRALIKSGRIGLQQAIDELNSKIKNKLVSGSVDTTKLMETGDRYIQGNKETIIENKYQTGNELLDETLKGISSYLDSIKSQGMKLNPNVEITPEITQKFLTQAETELEPYYSSQIKAIRTDLIKNLESLQKGYVSQKAKAESEFRDSLASSQEDFAGRGLAFSGQRQKTEQQFGESTGRYFEDLARTYQEKGTEMGSTAQRTIGSSNLDLSYPSIESYKPNIGTDFTLSSTGSRTLFAPESGVIGSLERERLAAKEARRADLEKSYRANRALTYY